MVEPGRSPADAERVVAAVYAAPPVDFRTLLRSGRGSMRYNIHSDHPEDEMEVVLAKMDGAIAALVVLTVAVTKDDGSCLAPSLGDALQYLTSELADYHVAA